MPRGIGILPMSLEIKSSVGDRSLAAPSFSGLALLILT
jgi:hypothetical protein